MELGYVFLVGLVLGFGISIPVGPINILCVQRTLTEGRRAGIIAGLGAATADSIYGLIAAIGLTLVADTLREHNLALHTVGGSIMILLGAKTLYDGIRGRTNGKTTTGHRHWIRELASHAGNFFSTFLLTLTNPATIVAFAAMFAVLGLAHHKLTHVLEGGLWLGVFLGASAWWIAVVMFVSLFRKTIHTEHLATINKVAGILMAICGIAILVWPFIVKEVEPETASSKNFEIRRRDALIGVAPPSNRLMFEPNSSRNDINQKPITTFSFRPLSSMMGTCYPVHRSINSNWHELTLFPFISFDFFLFGA